MSQKGDSSWVKKLESQLLGKKFLRFYHILCRIICLATLTVQCAILDYYLIIYNNLVWLCWLIADVVVLLLFVFTVIVSYHYLEKRPIIPANLPVRKYVGELPLTYISWLVYSIILSVKICCLYALPDSIALQLDEKYFFGPNMLRTAVSLASVVIYMLVLTSHDARSNSKQSTFIQSIVGSVYMDVLDSAEFLGALRDESQVISWHYLDHFILAITCFNLILPTEGLFVLSRKRYGKIPVSLKFQFLHKVAYFAIVNVPFFIIRMIIWHLHQRNVSVFIVKNVLLMGLAVQHLHEVFIEMSEVAKADVHVGGSTGAGEPGGIVMQSFSPTDGESKKQKSTQAWERIEIAS